MLTDELHVLIQLDILGIRRCDGAPPPLTETSSHPLRQGGGGFAEQGQEALENPMRGAVEPWASGSRRETSQRGLRMHEDDVTGDVIPQNWEETRGNDVRRDVIPRSRDGPVTPSDPRSAEINKPAD